MPAKKLAGVLLALLGIGWYSYLKIMASQAAKAASMSAKPTTVASGLSDRRPSIDVVRKPSLSNDGRGPEPRAKQRLEDEEVGNAGLSVAMGAGVTQVGASPRPQSHVAAEKVPLLDPPRSEQPNTPAKKAAGGWSLWG